MSYTVGNAMFSSFIKHTRECCLVLDISSGSIGVGITTPTLTNDNDTDSLVWKHREYILGKNTELSQEEIVRRLNASILNTVMKLSSDGLKVLYEKYPKAQLVSMLVSLRAPWVISTSRRIHYKSDDKPFLIDQKLVKKLTNIGEEKVKQIIKSETKNLHEIIFKEIIHQAVQGYPVENVLHRKATSILIVQLTALAGQATVDTVTECHQKLFPSTELYINPLMYHLYKIVKKQNPPQFEAVIIDVNDTTSEIGFIRDGVLLRTNYISFGIHNLIQALAKTCSCTYDEAMAQISDSNSEPLSKRHPEQLKGVEKVQGEYTEELKLLFTESHDELTIPRSIYLHAEPKYTSYLKDIIKSASVSFSKTEHTVHNVINNELVRKNRARTDDYTLDLLANNWHETKVGHD